MRNSLSLIIISIFCFLTGYAQKSGPKKTINQNEPNIIYFEVNSPELVPNESHKLDALVSGKKVSAGHLILLFGYADYRGAKELNVTLSTNRALKVREYLLAKGLHKEDILVCVGRGPIDVGDVDSNRRVEIITDPAIISKYIPTPLNMCTLFQMQVKEGEKRAPHGELNDSAVLKDETICVRLTNGDKYIGQLYPDGSKINNGEYVWVNGERYLGDYKNNMKDGRGKYMWPNGDVYIGEWSADSATNGELKVISCDETYHNNNFHLIDSFHLVWVGFNGKDSVRLTDTNMCQIHDYIGKFRQGMRQGQGMERWLTISDNLEEKVFTGVFKDDERNGFGTEKSEDYTYAGDWVNGKEDGNGKAKFSDGDSYEGKWKVGEMSGKGVYTWKNGDTYDGSVLPSTKIVYNTSYRFIIRNGTSGTMIWKKGDKYIGDWKNDQKSGEGKFTTKGYVYDGDWKDDKKNGSGTMTWSNGEKYAGEWKDDKRNGSGKMEYSNGNKYDGEWVNDKENGNGKMVFSTGNIYDGEWVDGIRRGHCKYTYINGDKYDGEFMNEKKNGQGTFTFSDKRKFVGEFKDDFAVSGTLTDPDGGVYVGSFMLDGRPVSAVVLYERNGAGTQKYADGTKYVGEWRNDQRNGKGILYDKDGKTLKNGKWQDGDFMGE